MADREDNWFSYDRGQDMTGESTYNPGTPTLLSQKHAHFFDDTALTAGAGLFPAVEAASPRRVPVPPGTQRGGAGDSLDQRSPRKTTHMLSSSMEAPFVNKVTSAAALEEKRRVALLERQRATLAKEASLKMTSEVLQRCFPRVARRFSSWHGGLTAMAQYLTPFLRRAHARATGI